MANVTIENVPDEVLAVIASRAKEEDESVNEFLLDLLNREYGSATMW